VVDVVDGRGVQGHPSPRAALPGHGSVRAPGRTGAACQWPLGDLTSTLLVGWQVVNDRGHDGEHDAVLDAEHHDGRSGQGRDGEFVPADAKDAPQAEALSTIFVWVGLPSPRSAPG
jgi:hypothetical protein